MLSAYEAHEEIDVAELADFLSPGANRTAFQAGIRQLHSVLSLLSSDPAAAAAVLETHKWSITSNPPRNMTALEEMHPQEPRVQKANGKGDLVPVITNASAKSDLKPSAAEFRPFNDMMQTSTAASLGEKTVTLDRLEINDGVEVGEHGVWDRGADPVSEGADWYVGNGGYAAEFPSSTGSEFALNDPAAEEAFLTLLQSEFPGYSFVALRDLFVNSGRSLSATIDLLYSLENELIGQMHSDSATTTACSQQSLPKFSDDDFPSLGAGLGSGRPSSGAPVIPLGTNYAGKAKIGAHKPNAGASTTTAQTMRSQRGSTSRQSAAPVWEAQGVERFGTGAAVAAEYAEVRATARDHARLRNACFQQATQAYLAGNKALAKELGAKGRWHNVQMKAAHAEAAATTFYSRNAAAFQTSNKNTDSRYPNGIPTIDLHGLHVSEAVRHLEEALRRLKATHSTTTVRVVVGIGQHGKTPARLPNAVRDFLEEKGMEFREPYQGLLEICL